MVDENPPSWLPWLSPRQSSAFAGTLRRTRNTAQSLPKCGFYCSDSKKSANCRATRSLSHRYGQKGARIDPAQILFFSQEILAEAHRAPTRDLQAVRRRVVTLDDVRLDGRRTFRSTDLTKGSS
jgi:hypothetical protein